MTAISDLINNFETKIEALTPDKIKHSELFRLVRNPLEYESRNSSFDRKFEILLGDKHNMNFWGVPNQMVFEQTVTIRIGYLTGNNSTETEKRIGSDADQIAENLSRPVNYSIGLWLLEPVSQSTERFDRQYWIHSINFRCIYQHTTT